MHTAAEERGPEDGIRRQRMKYLMTEGLLTEDFDRFVEAHDTGNDFVDEYSLRDFAESFGEYTAQQAAERGFGVNKGILDDGIVQGLIADINVVVCYPDDAKGYRRFGKKIITVESSDKIPVGTRFTRRNENVHNR